MSSIVEFSRVLESALAMSLCVLNKFWTNPGDLISLIYNLDGHLGFKKELNALFDDLV